MSYSSPEPSSSLALIRSLLEGSAQLQSAVIHLPAGTAILSEGEANDSVYILLEGEVILQKRDELGKNIQTDHFTPGALLGLTSFWSGTRSFVSSVCLTQVSCLKLDRSTFDQQMQAGDAFSHSLQTLFIDNLSERYRRMVALNMKVVRLSRTLEAERDQLRTALQNLEEAQGRLVHQEKLATLGQLLSGIAHEINNPCAALVSSSEQLASTLQGLFAQLGASDCGGQHLDLLNAGLQSDFIGTDEKRQRLASIQARYPALPRPFARRLAALPEDYFHALLLPSATNEADVLRQWEPRLPFFEAGFLLHSVQLSGKRIGDLVLSLKNYGRRGGEIKEEVDLVTSMQDTLRVLRSKLQPHRVHLDASPLPSVWINPGEINQVWTNILINAADAMGSGGEIWISTRLNGRLTQVQIADNGPGIPDPDLERIFETNFTTKNSSKSFGLGLGLTISRNIVTKNGGTLTAINRPEGGAVFTVSLPLP